VQYHIDSYVIASADPLRKTTNAGRHNRCLWRCRFLNFGVSTPSPTVSLRSHHIEALGACRRPRRFTSAEDAGRQAEL